MSAARPTRRTLVRGAAWSVPVVAIAATAPAFAASTATTGFEGIPGTATKYNESQGAKIKHVEWDLLITNGPVAIQSIAITFTLTPTGPGAFTSVVAYGFQDPSGPIDATWGQGAITPVPNSNSTTITLTHSVIDAGATYRLHTDFAGGENAAGTIGATAVITYAGVSTPVTKTILPINWDSAGKDKAHTHPTA